MTNLPLVACVVTHTQEVIPGLNTPAFMFTWVWRAPEKKRKEKADTHRALIIHISIYYIGHFVFLLCEALCVLYEHLGLYFHIILMIIKFFFQ